MKHNKMILKLAIPILCNYFITTAFELMDQAIVGHYSTEAYAAVGVISKIIYVLTGSFGIFTSAFHITAAKWLADKNERAFEQTFHIAVRIVHITGAIFFGAALIGGRFFCHKILGLSGDVLDTAAAYLYPAALTLWLNMILFVFSAYFRNRLNTKIALWSTIVSTAVNLFFDYSLVYGRFGMPELGGSGAAWGSVIGLAAGISVYLFVYLRRKKHELTGEIGSDSLIFKQMVQLYLPLLIQDFMECSIFTMVLSSMITRLSVVEIAVYQLLDALGGMIVLPVFAFSSAALTLSVQKQKEEAQSYSYIQSARGLAWIAVGLLGLIVMIFPSQICHIMVSDLSMNAQAATLLPMVVILQFIRVFYELDKSYLQGTGDEVYTCRSTIVISICSLIFLAVLIAVLHIPGAYAGLMINHLIFAFCYHIRVKKSI